MNRITWTSFYINKGTKGRNKGDRHPLSVDSVHADEARKPQQQGELIPGKESMKAKQGEHTPGPWTVEEDAYNPKGCVVLRDTTEKVEQAGVGYAMAICQAWRITDAALIAAAPDLLAACKAALEAYRNEDYDDYFHGEQLEVILEKAIEKAEGNQ